VSTWLTALVAIASTLLGGGGLAVLVNAVTGRRARKVEVADRLSDSSLKWVEQFQEETRNARLEASEARRELAEVRREMAEVHREAEGLARDLRDLRGAIMAPNVTLERLRRMVGGGGFVNGQMS
jgi:transposase-like protein